MRSLEILVVLFITENHPMFSQKCGRASHTYHLCCTACVCVCVWEGGAHEVIVVVLVFFLEQVESVVVW